MERFETLLDMLDLWVALLPCDRVTPEEFCADPRELLDEFLQRLGQRGVLTALLSGVNSQELKPEAMLERMQNVWFSVVQFHA